MATQTSKMAASKPSFASIAAMAPPTPDKRSARIHDKENRPAAPSRKSGNKAAAAGKRKEDALHQELPVSMSRLAVKHSTPVSNPLNDEQKSNISRAGLRIEDDQNQPSSSSSTKPASLDGKSTTSGTTFALDEKESLRPDDSASVKATDDDDLGSGLASGTHNSRVGSEAGSRAFRDQFHEITENIGSGPHRMHPLSRRIITGIEEEDPQTIHAPPVTTMATPVNIPPPQLAAVAVPSIDYQYQEPDEKIYEALVSPKDRLFLLRLEQEVITFVRDSTEPMIDLPPCNSFCRLLAHKLADYYALTHFVDNAVSSVRLYRTPYCRIPTPLSALVSAPSTIDNPPPSQPTMKIMRRAGLGKDEHRASSGPNTTDGSKAPSKAGSDTGTDSQQNTSVASPTESNLAKEKSAMTREEREAKYKETRERIFGPESELADGSDAVNEISRTSSRNDRKKKKHRNTDDGFTARSQYNAYYPQMQYPLTGYEQTPDCPTYYSTYPAPGNSAIGQSGGIGTTVFPHNFQQDYQTMVNSQGFPIAIMGGYDMQQPPVYNQQMPNQYYPAIQHGIGVGQQVSAMSSPALSSNGQFPLPQAQMPDQQWQQNGYHYQLPQSRDPQQFVPPPMNHQILPVTNVQSVPYQYGQLPLQNGMSGAKAQHPLPGSYKSQSFNPQTRAFIPNGRPVPSQMVHPLSNPNHNMNQAVVSNGSQYPTYTQQVPSYPQMPSVPLPPPPTFGHEPRPYGARKISAQANSPQSPAQNSLSKWGTPAHLPPKPPPQAPTLTEGQHSLPLNNQFNVNVQPMNGGQPMPTYQNGVWSLPGAMPQAT